MKPYILNDIDIVVAKMMESYQGYYYAGPFVYRLQSDDFIPSEVLIRYDGGVIMRDYEGQYSTAAYLRDHLGSTRVKVRNCDEIVGVYDYLPYGELASYCPPSDQSNDYLFGGKELESAQNVGWYDSGARYQTTSGIFASQDPLAEKYYSISPYAYCAGNPVNNVDPDGNVVWFVPLLVKGAVGAAIDAGTQVFSLMNMGNTFQESLKKIDLTSVGTAFVSSALLSPGASKGVKIAALGLEVTDVLVDYSTNDGLKSIGYGKETEELMVDAAFSIVSGIASSKTQKAFIKDFNAKMEPSIYAPMTKIDKQKVRTGKSYVESDNFATLLDWIFSFYFGATDKIIVEYVVKSDESNNKE